MEIGTKSGVAIPNLNCSIPPVAALITAIGTLVIVCFQRPVTNVNLNDFQAKDGGGALMNPVSWSYDDATQTSQSAVLYLTFPVAVDAGLLYFDFTCTTTKFMSGYADGLTNVISLFPA